MNGEILYSKYVQRMLDYGVTVDTWDQIEESDRAAWQYVAEYCLEQEALAVEHALGQ